MRGRVNFLRIGTWSLKIEQHEIWKAQDCAFSLITHWETQKVRKEALDVFKFVADIAAATIIGKRVIVPFIATPLANVVKGKMEEHKHKDDPKVEEKHEIDHDDDDDVKEIDD